MRSIPLAARCAAAVCATALATVACGSSAAPTAEKSHGGASPSGSCDSTGVTAKTIHLGGIAPLSGPQAALFKPIVDGWKVRIQEQNDRDGVNGRQLKVTNVDDGGSVQQSVTAANQLWKQDKVFGVFMAEPLTSASAPIFSQEGIPVVGYNVNPEWGKYKNMFGYSGSNSPTPKATTTLGEFLKRQGITKLGIIGTSVPGVVQAAKQNAASFEAAGGKTVLVSTSASLNTSNWLSQAQEFKKSGADGLYVPVPTDQAVQIVDAIHQVGADPKVTVLPQGYGPATLHRLGSAANGLTFATTWVPYEARKKVTGDGQARARAAFKKYAPDTPITDTLIVGYLSGDLMIKGLVLSGKDCPSQAAFRSKLRKVTDYTANGFFNPPIDFSTDFGETYGRCFHFVTVKHGKFVPQTNGKAICGHVIKSKSR